MEDRTTTRSPESDTREYPFGQHVLPDGKIVRFRLVRPDDEPLIAEAIRTASQETLLHRFFSPIRRVPSDVLRRMLAIDRSREFCVVGVLEEPSGIRIICGARYVRLADGNRAEIAVTIHDDFQRMRLGTTLLKIVIEQARADGIRELEADVMATNTGMLRLMKKTFPAAILKRSGPTCHYTMQL